MDVNIYYVSELHNKYVYYNYMDSTMDSNSIIEC